MVKLGSVQWRALWLACEFRGMSYDGPLPLLKLYAVKNRRFRVILFPFNSSYFVRALTYSCLALVYETVRVSCRRGALAR